MRYAPTWREYRFDVLPALNNMALYAEDKLSMAINTKQNVELTAGVREDITSIPGSEYGTVGSLSPRVNMRYMFRFGQESWVNSLSVHSGWGKSVKLRVSKYSTLLHLIVICWHSHLPVMLIIALITPTTPTLQRHDTMLT